MASPASPLADAAPLPVPGAVRLFAVINQIDPVARALRPLYVLHVKSLRLAVSEYLFIDLQRAVGDPRFAGWVDIVAGQLRVCELATHKSGIPGWPYDRVEVVAEL